MSAYEFEKRLLEVLRDNRHHYLAGDELLEGFGLAGLRDRSTESGQDLARAVEVLRLQGYEIDGDELRGWRLVCLPEAMSYFEIERGLATSFLGRCLFTYRIIGSTNETARMLAESGAADGTLLVAEEQRAGRGRRGTGWYSPAGGSILASLILRPGLRPAQAGSLALLTALSICLTLERLFGLEPRIKWPNDIYLEGRKLAGILCEAGLRGEELRYLVLGFGINVNIESFPPALASGAISLQQATGGGRLFRVPILLELLDRLEEGYFQFLTDGFASFLPRVQLRDFLRGRELEVQLPNGELVRGVARGISEQGGLLLESAGGGRLRTLAQGHVIGY